MRNRKALKTGLPRFPLESRDDGVLIPDFHLDKILIHSFCLFKFTNSIKTKVAPARAILRVLWASSSQVSSCNVCPLPGLLDDKLSTFLHFCGEPQHGAEVLVGMGGDRRVVEGAGQRIQRQCECAPVPQGK